MNVLILTGSFGMGHNAAASAIAEYIGAEMKDSVLFVEDLFLKTLKSRMYNASFDLVVKYGTYLYNFVYRNSQDSGMVAKLPFHRQFVYCLQDLIKKTRADVILSTFPYCSKIVSDYKCSGKCSIPLITCITDVSSHCEWLHPQTDFYLVAALHLREDLIRKGVESWRIVVSGIPVRQAFQKKGRHVESNREKKLLMMGGGLGFLPKAGSFYDELNRLNGVKTTVITGKNRKLYKSLVGKFENIEVLAYVHDIPAYMKNADLLLSKPGGITVFEAIAAELPLLIFPPFLQHEVENGEFIIENGMGEMLPIHQRAWAYTIRDILNDGEKQMRIRENMRAFTAGLDMGALTRILDRYYRLCA